MAHVYLLHFYRPISDKHTAQHYLGSAQDLDERIRQHRQGKGARFTQVACERQITFKVAEVWQGGRELEKKLKQRKNSRIFCPICNPC